TPIITKIQRGRDATHFRTFDFVGRCQAHQQRWKKELIVIMPKHFTCCRCHKRCKSDPAQRRPVQSHLRTQTENDLGRPLEPGDVICSACRRRLARIKDLAIDVQHQHKDTIDPDYQPPAPFSASIIKSPKSIQLQINSTPRNHKNCVICKKPSGHRNHHVVIPSSAITQTFVYTGIFINSDSRCCKFHLDNGYFNSETLSLLNSTKETEYFSRTDISNLIENVRNLMRTTSNINFDIPSALSDEDYRNLTGISREQFSELTTFLPSVRNTLTRSIRTCLAVFLTKLRTGLTNSILSSLFSLSISQVQRIISSVCDSLMENFVPLHLGFQHISHDEFCVKHTTPIAKTLFTSNSDESKEAVLVLDGTYVYIQKSSDYHFQRKSYSLHKNRPLVKPMMIVGTDGYILSVIGPYMADFYNNDANIVKHMMETNSDDIKDWLQENDVMVVDRGFRDAVNYLQENGFKVEMPSYLSKGHKQHSTEEANLSRLVTKVRWVVESVNGRIKQWKLLDKVVPNTLVPKIGDFVRIICALCNKFRPPLASMDPESEHIAQKMLEKVHQSNSIQTFVEENNLLKRKTPYKCVEVAATDLIDFPKLTMDKLRDITMGIYQIKQSIHYSREHLKEDGSYELMVCKECPSLLRVKIQSRHSKNTIHTLWIRYDVDEQDVSGWYCTCKVGARIIGCCAHIASVLWYLGYGRHQDQLFTKTSSLEETLHDAVSCCVDNVIEE
ncbi:hypothetical protein KUTeg_006826, partial [Tegillarca granosa]